MLLYTHGNNAVKKGGFIMVIPKNIASKIMSESPQVQKFIENGNNWVPMSRKPQTAWIALQTTGKPFSFAVTLQYGSRVVLSKETLQREYTAVDGTSINPVLAEAEKNPEVWYRTVRKVSDRKKYWVLLLPLELQACVKAKVLVKGKPSVATCVATWAIVAENDNGTLNLNTLQAMPVAYLDAQFEPYISKGKAAPNKQGTELQNKNLRAYRSGDGVYDGIAVDLVLKNGDMIPLVVAENYPDGSVHVTAYGDVDSEEPTYLKQVVSKAELAELNK